jgi:hypothetical protein
MKLINTISLNSIMIKKRAYLLVELIVLKNDFFFRYRRLGRTFNH